jgi:hypothetical protein
MAEAADNQALSHRLQGAVAAIGVGVTLFLFQYWWTPRPGLAVYGLSVQYTPPEGSERLRHWDVLVENSGTRQATSVRLHLPGATLASFRSRQVGRSDGPALAALELGDLQPAESIVVRAWAPARTDPEAKPYLTHSEGYGRDGIYYPTSGAENYWSRRLFYDDLVKVWLALVAVGVAATYVLDRVRKRKQVA